MRKTEKKTVKTGTIRAAITELDSTGDNIPSDPWADVILVMKYGKVIERGRHDERLARNGFYAELYQSQFAAL